MHTALLQEAIKALGPAGDDLRHQPIHHGLINRSYCIEQPNAEKIFLQQINQHVFTHPDWITSNLIEIYGALQAQDSAHLIARPRNFSNGEWLFRDTNGQYWRASEFIDGSTFFRASDTQQLAIAVKSFASFTTLLSSMDPALLRPTLTDFHNLSLRFSQFQQATKQGDPARMLETAGLIEELYKRFNYVALYDRIVDHPSHFKKRIMHHDAKISNLIFDQEGKKVLAVADLDTTMPGFFFSDLGDMIRSMAAASDENSMASQDAIIVPETYEIIQTTYRSVVKDRFTESELSMLHSAGLLMIYMQALRFLTDYLLGDTYYRTDRPGQNRDRATHQWSLLASLETLLKKKYQFSID